MKIICRKCGAIYDSLSEWESVCRDKHDWRNWSGDKYELVEHIEEILVPESFRLYNFRDYPFAIPEKEDKPIVYDVRRGVYYKYPEDLEEIIKHPYSTLLLTILRYLAFRTRDDMKNKSREEILKLAYRDALAIGVSSYLKSPEKTTQLEKLYNGYMEDLIAFLKGEKDYCPLCNLKMLDFDRNIYNELFKKPQKLKYDNPEMYKVKLEIKGQPTQVCLLRLCHVLTKHKNLLKTAQSLGIINGVQGYLERLTQKKGDLDALRLWLRNKQEQETLHVKKEEEKLTKKEELMLKWLRQRVKYET